MTTKISYAVGDLINGDDAKLTFKDRASAVAAYREEVEGRASELFNERASCEGQEDWDISDFVSECEDFFYVVEITTVVDEDGDEEESREIIEGGTWNENE